MSESLRCYLDASIPIAVSQALDLIRPDIEYPGKPGCPVTRPDVKDPVWLKIVGDLGWVVIMRDKKTKHRPRERPALHTYGIRAFTLTAGGNLNKWKTTSLLISKWSTMEDIARWEPAPFLYAITTGAPRRIPL